MLPCQKFKYTVSITPSSKFQMCENIKVHPASKQSYQREAIVQKNTFKDSNSD